MQLLSALGGGLWIIPVGLFLASLWSFYRGYTQWKSGSKWWGKDASGRPKQFESDERVSYLSVGATVFGIILLACAIGSFIWMQAEK